MINAGDLIGALMQGGLNNVGNQRLGNALGPSGLGGAGMRDILGGLLGGGGNTGRSAAPGGGGLGDLLGGLFGGGKGAGVGNAALGGVLGGLVGGRGGMGGMAKGGAMAVLGMLAVNALKGYMSNQAQAGGQTSNMQLMAGLREPEDMEERKQVEDLATLIVRAMINAAKADGNVDETEMGKIVGRLRESGADERDLAYVRQELAAPMDTNGIISAVRDPQVAAQVYAASLMAITVDSEAERRYIDELGTRLELPREARENIHQMLGL